MSGPPRALPSGSLVPILGWAAVGVVLWFGMWAVLSLCVWVVLR
jgi:hypothetical protein